MQTDTSYRRVVIRLLLAGIAVPAIQGCDAHRDPHAQNQGSSQLLATDDGGTEVAGSGGRGGSSGRGGGETDGGVDTDGGLELDGAVPEDTDGGTLEPPVLDAGPAPTADAGPAPTADAGPARDAGADALNDRQIGAVMTSLNTAVVLQSRLASSRAGTQAVTDYAARMVSEHSASNGTLARHLSSVGISRSTNPLSQRIIIDVNNVNRTLSPLAGAEFDAAYMAAQIEAHTAAITILDESLIPAALTPIVQEDLVTMRAMLLEHLEAAQAIGE
jgi:putative membrane protein